MNNTRFNYPHEMESREDGFVNELEDRVRFLTDENVQLRDKNERLFNRLGSLQSKLGQLAGSKTDLSSKLVNCEEEKLKMAKDLIDVQIHTNKMREQYEAETFELKNKILFQENQLMEMEMERDRLHRDIQHTRGRLQVADKSYKELVDEYITLKSNYLVLSESHEKEVCRNEELSAELLSLANAQDSLLRQQENQARSQAVYGETAHELERVRALVSRMSQHRARSEELAASEQERKAVERSILGNQDQIKEELERMKKSYEEQQRRLEEKVVAMGKEQQENKRAIRSTQHKLAEQSAALLSSKSQLKEVEVENSRLQMQVKELNEEYRARLVRYLTDLAEYVDGLSDGQGAQRPPERAQMKNFVDSMLQDVRASYRSREEQLSSAARAYKKRLQKLVKTHEALLIAYRMQREQILALGERGLDPGPPEAHFGLTDSELQVEQSRELQRLREDKARLESQLRDALEQKNVRSHPVQSVSFQESRNSGKITEDGWSDIRKQLREFTHSTQEEQERERAQLITRATVAEEQALELQDYVDKHLGRYKQEVTRLRRLLRTEAGRAHSAQTPEPRALRRSKKTPSYEI
ncbi:coiled-coil domain-containing protein 78 isoform X2 [Anguilla rostrata]|uniref:coiled-coil domain-containing protein 78 isoform X2 n=1 Tax=Anguilla anguilla TaxID=7936 RepID=UPI0015B07F7E|nr:coiled-coil domain-containing protein 78 isoform X2 [Anguilla anguilla]